ncbi:MAG: hypothetical protein IJQ39_11040 [Thermoguttaceae bacterium]|nr:hypothetical protein [Thermoguttaceae bacterium]
MKGGNEVSEANGITQFAEGEPKRRSVQNNSPQPKTILDRGRKSAEESSRKVREVRKEVFNHIEHKEHKEMKGSNGATIGSVVTLYSKREIPYSHAKFAIARQIN